MSLKPTAGERPTSPAGSGRSSPAPRFARQTVEEGVYKSDKALRRYGATIERALNSWEISPQEWADYIAFLGRLLKAIQSHPKDARLLPYSAEVSSKLAQCLNPVLPSGVHQKALEVYEYIFSTFGLGYISGHLHEFLPGLSAVLSFASLSVRPALYALYEDWIVHLPASDLRPVLRSLVLSLLPALEEETSEDFDRAFRIVERLDITFSQEGTDDPGQTDQRGFFWQCLFLAVITCPSRRQGALNYLAQKLPKFGSYHNEQSSEGNVSTNGASEHLSVAAKAVISPEPGLLIRCFVCGLADPQILIQRGFLDLLVTHLPLNSSLLQERIGRDDLDRLVTAAIHVLLRRDMSLNRRLWSWFLGPEQKESAADNEPSTSSAERRQSTNVKPEGQFQYFIKYGRVSLERCVLALFTRKTTDAAERARPFRICLSLMDRWEIGGSIISRVFLPAVESAYQYSLIASTADSSEVVRSASLFFDGIEASLIFSKLREYLLDTFTEERRPDNLQQFGWIVRNFNTKDEEMLTTHIPYAVVYTLVLLRNADDSRATIEKKTAVLDLVSVMLEQVPTRAFLSPSKGPEMSKRSRSKPMHVGDVEQALDNFYQSIEKSTGMESPLVGYEVSEMLYELLIPLLLQSLNQNSNERLGQAVSLLLTLQSKSPNSEVLRRSGIFDAMHQAVETATRSQQTLSFPTIDHILSLLSTLSSSQLERPLYIARTDISLLENLLTAQIWPHLSPSSPKYHVEAAKAIWQLQDLIAPDDCLEASLTGLMSKNAEGYDGSDKDETEAVRRFAVLWGQSISTPTQKIKSSVSGITRRGSTMPTISDSKQAARRQEVLTQPLMLALDLLDEKNDGSMHVVKEWVQTVPTLDLVLNIHFDLLRSLEERLSNSHPPGREESKRIGTEIIRDTSYVVGHFLNIIDHGNDWVWHCLGEAVHTSEDEDNAVPGAVVLAQYCIRFACSDEHSAYNLGQRAVSILGILLAGPVSASLRSLDLDARLMDRLAEALLKEKVDLQGPLLKLITQSLKLRLINENDPREVDRPRSSLSIKGPSTTETRPSPRASSTALAAAPPQQLLDCLQLGFSSKSARTHLDQWIEFLSNVLPIYSDAIFASLIPLVECFCLELRKAHRELFAMSKVDGASNVLAPEPTIIALLQALEMVLSRAHECLVDDHSSESVPRPTSQSRSLLSNVASGVFKAEGPPSRTSQANSRLTVILAFQDAIRVSLSMWIWASHHSNIESFDRSSAATTAYNALRVRNRTRHLMEEIFDTEPLESLEVVIYNWCYEEDTGQAAASLDLLHVMKESRPKNTVPAVLDSLCSRLNPNVLPADRMSSKTIDLEPQDIALFLAAYLQSVEDDAMDEVWADCMAFLKDVLANPLPWRQVLPTLLSVVLLLAQKVDNTNFGEQRKMRRELGDTFQRLLSATFTTMPSGYIVDPGTSSIEPGIKGTSNSAVGRRRMNLVAVLSRVMEGIEVVLETNDRTTLAINSISASLIGPIFHAKPFPGNVTSEVLTLLSQISKKAPLVRSWKKELLNAFDDPRLLSSSVEQFEQDWFPVLHQWCLHDKDRMPDLLARLTPPSSAGIMFGVGANAARLEADRKTQLNLRRICVLLLSNPEDTFVTDARVLEEKLVELFDASSSSSPSAAIKAELFMVCRAIALSTSSIHLAPMWPIINDNLQSALMSLMPNASNTSTFANLALLQACKLLDLLIALSPDEFQLYEWLYIVDTIDAVYRQPDSAPASLADQIAEALAQNAIEDGNAIVSTTPTSSNVSGRRLPLISNESMSDKDDIKAMARDDFARTVLRPFLSQLSIHAYEGVYAMDTPNFHVYRRSLLEDLLDLTTIVE